MLRSLSASNNVTHYAELTYKRKFISQNWASTSTDISGKAWVQVLNSVLSFLLNISSRAWTCLIWGKGIERMLRSEHSAWPPHKEMSRAAQELSSVKLSWAHISQRLRLHIFSAHDTFDLNIGSRSMLITCTPEEAKMFGDFFLSI